MRSVPCLLLLTVVTVATGADAPRRPNIVLIIADDLGYGELGCQGNSQIPTPHIDSIAGAGVRFTSGYVTAAYCSASRAGLMSGRYQTRFGYEFNPIGAANEDPRVGLPLAERTLAEHLRDAGYVTGLIGKWHLGGHAAYHPLRHGFDDFFGFLHEGHYYVPPPYDGVMTMLRRRTLPGGGHGRWLHPTGRLLYSTHMSSDEPAYDADNPILRHGQPVIETEYLTKAWTREALDFIKRNHESPFFLAIAHNAVHSPLQAVEADLARFAHIEDLHRRIFAGMLSSLDDSVGEVLAALRELGLEQHTLIFFISDNGGPTRELTSSNLPLRGGKGDLYEGGIRVPFLMQWKGTLPAGRVEDRPVISLDVYATAAAAAGAADRRTLDGVDLLPILRERSGQALHRSLYWRANRKAALRWQDWKLVRNKGRSGAEWELYDLSQDVGEQHDLADRRPQQLAEMISEWQRLDDQMIEPFWQP